MPASQSRSQNLIPVARHNPAFSVSRVAAMILRYWFLIKGSWPRIIELAYWPTVQLLMWGFLQTFLMDNSDFFAQAGGILLGAVILWDVLFRGQLGLSISFFEEMWSRNLGHLMVSPLRPIEMITALMVTSIIRTMIGLAPATLLATWFFGFSVYSMGLALAAFFFNLIVFGWALGLFVSGLVLRNGMGAESLAWALIFIFLPLCGVYYPVSILPDTLETVSYLFPPTYVFEGMRTLLMEQRFDAGLVIRAALLNAFYIAGGMGLFLLFVRQARERGMFLQIGE